MKERGYNVDSTAPKDIYKVLKDNREALELARFPKFHSRTEYINEMYHHFRSHILNGNTEIYLIDTSIQIEDLFTKLLPKEKFCKLCSKLISF